MEQQHESVAGSVGLGVGGVAVGANVGHETPSVQTGATPPMMMGQPIAARIMMLFKHAVLFTC